MGLCRVGRGEREIEVGREIERGRKGVGKKRVRGREIERG